MQVWVTKNGTLKNHVIICTVQYRYLGTGTGR